MSVAPERAPAPGAAPPARLADRLWRGTAVAGAVLLAGLLLALVAPHQAAPAVAVSVAGALLVAVVLGPRVAAAAFRRPVILAAGVVVALVVLRIAARDTRVGAAVPALRVVSSWWVPGRTDVGTLALMVLAATGGLVLIADGLRTRLAGARGRRAPWQALTASPTGAASIPWRAIAGVLLVGWAASLGVGFAGPYVRGNAVLQVVLLLFIVGGVAVVIGTPLAIAWLARLDRDQAGRARDDERQRFAAHLHDSVLQTLALVQRQADDPAAVARIARRQEHALRAWMAGETELSADTLGSALREVVAALEDEHGVSVELSIIGERALDGAGEALAAAAREALRNAVRHAPGAALFVFAQLSPAGAEVFVRDEGPGFDPAAVPAERRGTRDAIVGRMAAAGGSATIDTAPGEGTEVALRIGERR